MSEFKHDPSDQSMSELLRAKVNALGELHLSREFAPLLIKWIENTERQIQMQRECIESVRSQISEIGDSNDRI